MTTQITRLLEVSYFAHTLNEKSLPNLLSFGTVTTSTPDSFSNSLINPGVVLAAGFAYVALQQKRHAGCGADSFCRISGGPRVPPRLAPAVERFRALDVPAHASPAPRPVLPVPAHMHAAPLRGLLHR